MDNITIITVATHEKGYFKVLRGQLKDKGIDFHVLGYGDKWQGWIWRTNKIIEYLKTNHDPNDLVMIVDGYDVLVPGNKKDIVRKYKEFDTDIVFSISLSLSQKDTNLSKYIIMPASRRYFRTTSVYMKCAGTLMGSAKSLIIIYERILKYNKKTNTSDDQLALNNINLDDIDHKMDTSSKIFWIWGMRTPYELIYNFIYSYRPDYLYGCDINKDKIRPEFSNGILPEVIHGVSHRDMSRFVTDPDFKHINRKYAQEDINMSMNIKRLVLLLFIIIVIYCSYKYMKQ